MSYEFFPRNSKLQAAIRRPRARHDVIVSLFIS